jgi:hypothetical protein
MKKILKAIAIIMCLALPMSAMAMTTIADNELSSVTGQSGVSINLDVNMNVTANVISWGDADGFITPGNAGSGASANTSVAGYVGLTNLGINNLEISYRKDLLAAGWAGHLGTNAAGWLATQSANTQKIVGSASLAGQIVTALTAAGYTSTTPGFVMADPGTWGAADVTYLLTNVAGGPTMYATYKAMGSYYKIGLDIMAQNFTPLTIDVATDNTHGTNISYVRIGLGAIEVKMTSMSANVVVGDDKTLNYGTGATGTAATLGTIYMGGLDMWVDSSSYVDIYNARGASTQGVTIYADVKIDGIAITSLAWGDLDTTLTVAGQEPGGTTNTVAAGWVGLKNLVITDLTVLGPINIDVATDTSFNGSTDQTYVNIGFGSGLHVGIGSMNATVALGTGATPTLSEELGSIYLSNLQSTITGNVKIGGHSNSATVQGVTIDLNLSIALSSFTISWGDLDGLNGDITATHVNAGYVGLSGVTINGLTLAGLVTIDVGTVAAATPGNEMSFMYSAYNVVGMGNSIVHIGLGSGDPLVASKVFAIGIADMTAKVVLDSTPGLNSSGASTLGSIFMSGINAQMSGWVDIGAH